ncbi:hypothetical protein M430DRAFT_33416 [Amorphotheca resinae ATCC 22711]|jgi:hypothetical protein|uniref:Uncharacterized protein n=1 Tax=Amorphotheca resinae ATCC 22711 TaxID=857342 RepID=A0A2T3BBZ6_AMORE|nr:hypothetical protein M430DRAFT_33416 [Amorphotheca resinae ATCC 22711]PSS25857.1 hypothetical protein M430DRAFT_33416 [Amorphotheca resinae ATCC 22711]
MPIFGLPFDHHSSVPQLRSRSALPRRKRKRASSSDEESFSEPELAPASTNPLSLAPEEIAQYRLAGLELNEELPSQGVDGVKDFPHRPLPVRFLRDGLGDTGKGKGKGKEKAPDEVENDDHETENKDEDEEEKQRGERGPRLRIQHLNVLTTILHRCLLEGDAPRASRAWAMLLREQFLGKHISLRATGYWAIGAEVLMHSQDRRLERRNSDPESSGAEQDQGDEQYQGQKEDVGEGRWGTAEGLEKAKAYYEYLILQYPPKRRMQTSLSSLDFWPAMLSCEIYGIQWEHRERLRKIAMAEQNEDEYEGSATEESEGMGEDEDNEEDWEYAANERRQARRQQRKEERIWQQKEEARQDALAAAKSIAARMDTLMTTTPYVDARTLIRLRGMLALYIGDLSVPALPIDNEEDIEGSRLRSGGRDERRFLLRQRQAEHEKGKQVRREERERAQTLFDRIVRQGGWVGDIKDVRLDEDDGAEELYSPSP